MSKHSRQKQNNIASRRAGATSPTKPIPSPQPQPAAITGMQRGKAYVNCIGMCLTTVLTTIQMVREDINVPPSVKELVEKRIYRAVLNSLKELNDVRATVNTFIDLEND